MRFDILLDQEEAASLLPGRATTELHVRSVARDPTDYLISCGSRLPRCRHVTVQSTSLVNLRFLAAFPALESLTVASAALENLDGLATQLGLKCLSVGESLSRRGDLRPIARLAQLEELGLSGPNPGKNAESIKDLRLLRHLSLYRPQWSLEHIPTLCPNVETLKVLHSSATSLDFVLRLAKIQTLEVSYFRKLVSVSPEVRRKVALSISHSPVKN